MQFAFLETDGNLSVQRKRPYRGATQQDLKGKAAKGSGGSGSGSGGGGTGGGGRGHGSSGRESLGPATAVVVDGQVMEEALESVGFSKSWLENELLARGVRDRERVVLALLNEDGRLYMDLRRDDVHPRSVY